MSFWGWGLRLGDEGGAAFSPLALFRNGELGAALIPTAGTTFEDAAGLVGSSVGQPGQLVLDSIGGTTRPVALAPPRGYPYTPSFTVTRTAAQTYVTNFDPADHEIAASVTYYLSPTGNDTNDGLTVGEPKKSIATLVTTLNGAPPAGGATLSLAPGRYLGTDSLNGGNIGFDCNLVCSGGQAILTYLQTMTWEKTGGYTNVWSSPVTGFPAAVDLTEIDAFGVARRLAFIATAGGNITACDAAQGSITFDGVGNVYVHTYDSRAPDADLLVFGTGTNGWQQTSAQEIFFQNVELWGWDQPAKISSATGTYVFSNVAFCYSRGEFNGFETTVAAESTMTTIMYNAVSAYNRFDGFGYRGAHTAVEIGCHGVWNGWIPDNPNDNGTTAHNTVVSLRINGVYRFNNDRNVHDINTTKNWLVGCTAGDADNASADLYNNSTFVAGKRGNADATLSWLEGCTSSGNSASDAAAYGNSVMETLDCVGLAISDTDSNGLIRNNARSIWVPGAHAAAVDATEYTLRNYGGLRWALQRGNATQLSVTLADLGIDATIAYADEFGVTITTGQTISGATSVPTSSLLGPVIYIDRALTSPETDALTKWLADRSPPAFPLSLFAHGEKGVIIDPSDLTTLWVEHDSQTTQVAANNDRVGQLTGFQNTTITAMAATASGTRLTYQTADGLHWLLSNGTSEAVEGVINDEIGVPVVAVWAGLTTVRNGFINIADPSVGDQMQMSIISSAENHRYTWSRTTDTAPGNRVEQATVATNTRYVTTSRIISETLISVQNGKGSVVTLNPGTALYVPAAGAKIAIGAMPDSTPSYWTGRIYFGLMINRDLAAKELSDLQTYAGNKAGLTL